MIYTPEIPLSAIFAVLLLSAAMPGISFAAEYALKKSISRKNIYLSIIISIAVSLYLFIQMFSTQAVINDTHIELRSLSFSNSIQLTDITKASFYDSNLPNEYQADWRLNGVGLYGYLIGKFKSNTGEKIYIQSTQPPYIVLTLNNNNPAIVMSADKDFYASLQSRLAQQTTR